MSDENIMKKIKEGQLDYASVLYERYHLRIYNYFLKLSFNRDISQDLMQDVFLRVIRHRITYKPDHKFAPWIYQVSRNVYSDFVKKEGRIKSNFIDLNNINTEVDSFLDDKEKADQVKVLQKALTKLSAEHREVLILTRYQNMKNKEVAKILDCKENAVKAKVHRAMKKLRSIYFEIEKN